jgi:hypothetical protein
MTCAGAQVILVRKYEILQAESLVELINTSTGVHKLLLARKEGVTLRADFDLYILLCRTGLNYLAAGTLNRGLFVVGMYSLLHHVHLSWIFSNSCLLLMTAEDILTYTIIKINTFLSKNKNKFIIGRHFLYYR